MTVDGTMAAMTASAVADAAARGAGVLLPVGVVEAHGPHLPTGTDVMIATTLCRLVKCYADRELLVAPPIAWGVNHVLRDFAGSFRVRPETARALIVDVLDSLVANGFSDVLVVSHHGDLLHNQVVLAAIEECRSRGGEGLRWLYAPGWPRMIERLGRRRDDAVFVDWEPAESMSRFRTTGAFGVHADEFETAAITRWFPEAVDYDALRDLPPTPLTASDLREWREGGEAARRLTPDGYFGAPNPVDPELWRFFDESARLMAAAIGARP